MSIKKITSENIVFEGQLTIFLISCKCHALFFFNMLKNSKYNGNIWIDWFSVQFWFLYVKTGHKSKAHNFLERLKKPSECFEKLYYLLIIFPDVGKRRAIFVAFCLTLSWRKPLSNTIDWFLFDNGPRHERVK